MEPAMRWAVFGAGVAFVAAFTACRRDPSAVVVEWADDACACTDKACAEAQRDELAGVHEALGANMIDTRMSAAENLGATCVETYGVTVDRRLSGPRRP